MSRTQKLNKLSVGQSAIFRARNSNERASVRGSAYHFGYRTFRQFTCKRAYQGFVRVTRVENTR